MNPNELHQKSETILHQLCGEPRLDRWVDASLGIPGVHRGRGPIRLVILGQDPTVKNERSRRKIHCVLNLDRGGSLRQYLEKICDKLNMRLDEDVYATNLVKNFFTAPPTQIKEMDVLRAALPYWLPLLEEELAEFPTAPVIALGEPLLALLVKDGAKEKVREYWGYAPGWKQGERQAFGYVRAEENLLGRVVYPFPHQPSCQQR